MKNYVTPQSKTIELENEAIIANSGIDINREEAPTHEVLGNRENMWKYMEE